MTKHVSLFHRQQPARPEGRSTTLFKARPSQRVAKGDRQRQIHSDVAANALSAAHERMRQLVATN